MSLIELRTDNGMLCCPNCSDCNLHFVSVAVATEHNNTIIDHTGITTREIKNKGRGSTTVIIVECETCGNITEIQMAFHKGCILVSDRYVGNTDIDGWIPELWRD